MFKKFAFAVIGIIIAVSTFTSLAQENQTASFMVTWDPMTGEFYGMSHWPHAEIDMSYDQIFTQAAWRITRIEWQEINPPFGPLALEDPICRPTMISVIFDGVNHGPAIVSEPNVCDVKVNYSAPIVRSENETYRTVNQLPESVLNASFDSPTDAGWFSVYDGSTLVAIAQFQPQHGNDSPADAWGYRIDGNNIDGAHTMMWEWNTATNSYVFTNS